MKDADNVISIRRFNEFDIKNKIEWINDPLNNRFLHYDLPLEYEKTLNWYYGIKDSEKRADFVIEYARTPVGLIGLLSIDHKNNKAEYYISMGDHRYKRRGVSTAASLLLLEYAFNVLGLNKVYLLTDAENKVAQKLFNKIGFVKEGLLRQELWIRDKFIDRVFYGLLKEDFINASGKIDAN